MKTFILTCIITATVITTYFVKQILEVEQKVTKSAKVLETKTPQKFSKGEEGPSKMVKSLPSTIDTLENNLENKNKEILKKNEKPKEQLKASKVKPEKTKKDYVDSHDFIELLEDDIEFIEMT